MMIDLLGRSAPAGVELSRTTANDSVGVLACAGTDEAAELLRAWRPSSAAVNVPPRMRFARCDFTRRGCELLTLYFDGDGDAPGDLGPLSALPVYARALRIWPDGETESTTYVDIRLLPATGVTDAVVTAAQQLGFRPESLAAIREAAEPLVRLGWQQTLAVTPRRGTVKFGISAPRLSDAVSLVSRYDSAGAARLSATIRRCGGSLGYAGLKARATGELSWRFYARPFRCADLARTVEGLL